ncbi:asparagine synthase-related protein [Tropicimonas isoalkanivorans]|uniref:asparagine synthase (glutamine-hydrolyzing) n=1 Tax=Tropicimonas isoalkanivorans TaxID=441112 RepID=A0A1I1N452_9RHOB|nr:asparagine synthase-related protein [Tropicimonas isoalkanivorans]SFC92126.1 asparagine synthase (glutamine-hydrolysing) [Tropicimonas isoalkanivorans]
MGAIFGLLNRRGGVVSRESLVPMAKDLATRAPDGTRYFVDGAAALGNGHNLTTPDAVRDEQPLRHPPTGCTLTADIRLDNREELLTALDCRHPASDAELTLLAYLKWGRDCVDHLLGDFAFAIWDPRDQTLFAARDHMGMKPFAYFANDGWFVFGSTPMSVVAAPMVPRKLYEPRIADFLLDDQIPLEGIDHESTFWQDVYRLPPGHRMIVSSHTVDLSRYWQPTALSHSDKTSDGDYEAHFLEVFDEAVRCRLRMSKPGGIMLSGGLDSGSVAAAAVLSAGRPPLRTFSGVTDDPTFIETAMIRRNQETCGLQPVDVPLTDVSRHANQALADLLKTEEPFNFTATMPRQVYRTAADHGVSVMLDGVMGDVVTSTGSMILRLVRSGHVLTAYRDCIGEADFARQSSLSGALKFGRVVRRVLMPSAVRHLRSAHWNRHAPAEIIARSTIDPVFAKRVDAIGRIRAMRASLERRTPYDREAEAMATMVFPFISSAREGYDRIAAAWGIECRDPYTDRRLVEFCIGLPDDQKRRRGWPKHIVRRAMADRMPEDLRWRRGFQHVGRRFNNALEEAIPKDRVQAARLSVREYMKPPAGSSAENHTLMALTLEKFLERV